MLKLSFQTLCCLYISSTLNYFCEFLLISAAIRWMKWCLFTLYFPLRLTFKLANTAAASFCLTVGESTMNGYVVLSPTIPKMGGKTPVFCKLTVWGVVCIVTSERKVTHCKYHFWKYPTISWHNVWKSEIRNLNVNFGDVIAIYKL